MPRYFSKHAIGCYLAALLCVSALFSAYAMKWYWWVFGVTEVLGFFLCANRLSLRWAESPAEQYEKRLFLLSLALRVAAVCFLYVFFDAMTGQPFMFQARDSIGYDGEARWMVNCIKEGRWDAYAGYLMTQNGVSDWGYPLWLGAQYLLTGGSVIVARIVKALLSAWTCLLVYRLARRNFGDATGRMAGLFCALMPNLIFYCGMHLKETEMVFLTVAFLERSDAMLRQPSVQLKRLIGVLSLGGSLFFFRTVLGATALFALVLSVLLAPRELIHPRVKWGVGLCLAAALLLAGGGRISREVERYWNDRGENQERALRQKSVRGNTLAQYAGAAVFLPMIFTLPFPTMVETEGQETFRMLHGGLFVKNALSFFTIAALVALLRNKRWRAHTLVGAFLLSYLAVLALSSFAQSERFHMPALPFELFFAAYGVSVMTNRHKKYFNLWMILLFVADVAWAWFKLRGRGLI